MKHTIKWIILLWVTILSINGCGGAKIPPPRWSFEKEAIKLNIKADDKLNLYDTIPHTLFMCIYQLRDPNVFNTYLQTTRGLTDLLTCNRFDSSVLGFKKLFIQPQGLETVVMDRAEGARYVALVAGYFALSKENAVRLFEVPIVLETKGLINRKKIKKPARLALDVELGSTGIKAVGVKSEF